MIYNFEKEDEEDVPDLEEYKTRLAAQMLRSAFFQNEETNVFDWKILFRLGTSCIELNFLL